MWSDIPSCNIIPPVSLWTIIQVIMGGSHVNLWSNLFLDKSHYGLPTIFYNIFFAKCIYNPHYPLLIPTAPL